MKRKTKERNLSFEYKFEKQLRLQNRLRIKQFMASDKEGKEELLHRAKYATTKFLEVAKPFTVRRQVEVSE